jgi:CHRD domain
MKISMSRREIVFTACLAGIAAWAGPTLAAPVSFKVPLTGAQQVPPVQTAATGTADLTYDPATRVLTWSVAYNGVSGPATMAHFHGPASEGKNGPPVIWLARRAPRLRVRLRGKPHSRPNRRSN